MDAHWVNVFTPDVYLLYYVMLKFRYGLTTNCHSAVGVPNIWHLAPRIRISAPRY
jgi:hypothetical protein